MIRRASGANACTGGVQVLLVISLSVMLYLALLGGS